jgi:uncharacterized protein involved in exopolysaccharide biosynthesis
MTRTTPAGFSPTQIWETFERHKGKMALFFLVVMGGVAAFVLLGPRSYLSEAKLLVRLGRENVTLDPTATLGQAPVVAVPPSRENDINSVIEVARSRVILEKVADALGPQVLLNEVPLSAEDSRQPAQRYRAVRVLSRGLHVEAIKKSNVIAVTFEGNNPELAQVVVASVVDSFLDHHLSLHRTPRAPQFLAEQADRLRKELGRSEEELKRLKDRTGLVAPDGQLQQQLARIGKLEEDLVQTDAALAAATAEFTLLRQKLKELPPTALLTHTRGFPNQAADVMRGQLYALQLKELELLTKYPEENPEVRLLRKQIVTAKEILAKEEGARDQLAEGPSKAYEEAQLAVLKQEPIVAGLRARAKTLRSQLAQERDGLKRFSGDQLELKKQQRLVDLQESLVRRYSESVEQAQIDQALTQERITNIGIVQPATYELKPFRPRVGLALALGLAFALLGSISLALVAEQLGSSVQEPPALSKEPAAFAELAHGPGPAAQGSADTALVRTGPGELVRNGQT